MSPKQEAEMKEADLFRQLAKEAMRRSSSNSTRADEKRELINLACRYAQAALMSEGVVLGSSFIPSPPETHPEIKLAVIEQHLTRRDFAVYKSTVRAAAM
jgi:hypothetical protein